MPAVGWIVDDVVHGSGDFKGWGVLGASFVEKGVDDFAEGAFSLLGFRVRFIGLEDEDVDFVFCWRGGAHDG